MKEPAVTCVSAVHDKGTEFMRKYIEMTSDFGHNSRQNITVRGCFRNIERKTFDKLCRGGRSNG